jgi:hypothetical protein
MKREESLLNLICLVCAGAFFALAIYNVLSAGSVISTDGLFFTVVPLVLALSFLSVPGQQMLARRLERRALAAGGGSQQVGAGSGAPALAGGSAPALKDARGRAMPPDVNRIMAELRAPRSKES